MRRVLFEGDRPMDRISGDDRGFTYGDGLFETMRVHAGTVPWWGRHWTRLALGAGRLRLALPAEALVREQVAALLAGGSGVLRLQVTRGRGGRGYAAPAACVPTWMLSCHAVPEPHAGGIALRWCETRLALQPLLAGIKHCNRLEQVLARSEWTAPDIHEGLLRSTEGDVVGATAGNLFLLRDGCWITPRVDRCGIAGVCRAWVMDVLPVQEQRVSADDVNTADALFVCNAVRGILPVARLGNLRWGPHPQIAGLRARLAGEHPAFSDSNAPGCAREP